MILPPELAQWVKTQVHGSLGNVQTVSNAVPQYAAQPDEIAFLQHSSGTTGLQKGVALSHRAVLSQLASYAEALELNADDTIASWLPLYHDMGLIAGFLLPLVQGVHLVLMSPFDWVRHPALLLKAIDQYQATFCWLPNFAYNHITRRVRRRDVEGLSLQSIRAFINCSEPVMHDSHQQFLERFADLGVQPSQLGVSYAMAENTFAVTQTPLGKPATVDIIDRASLENEQKAVSCDAGHSSAVLQVSCGLPIAGTNVQIVNAGFQPLDERNVGEIAIQSDYMLSEYYRRPDLNDTLLQDGWYLTGDMGYLAAGEVYVIGRKKDYDYQCWQKCLSRRY